jgi:type IV pilus assembly protein PilV
MKHQPTHQKGVMLLEALIGILIFSIGILALIAMQATAVSQVRDSKFRTEASMLANRMLGEMTLLRSTSTTGASTVISGWKSSVASTLPNGNGTITETANALNAANKDITITITWRAPGATADSNHMVVGLLAYNAFQ